MGGTYQHRGITEDPESFKRKRSGFWRHDYDYATGTDRWTCDVRKLREEVGRAMTVRSFAEQVAKYGIDAVLDAQHGEGTARAFHTKLQGDAHLIRMDFDRFAQQYRRDDRADAMAMSNYFINSGTTTATSTATSGSTFTKKDLMWIQDNFLKEEVERQKTKMVTHGLFGTKLKREPVRFKSRRLLNPFKISCGRSLIEQLDVDFNRVCHDQLAIVRG